MRASQHRSVPQTSDRIVWCPNLCSEPPRQHCLSLQLCGKYLKSEPGTKRCIVDAEGGREGALRAVLLELACEPSGECAERQIPTRGWQQAQLLQETKPGASPCSASVGVWARRPTGQAGARLSHLSLCSLGRLCPELRCASSEAPLQC